jgi:hypothetical protein
MVGVILNFAKHYYKTSTELYSVKLSKENWSIIFYLFRDFSLFFSYGMSLLLINPDMFADVKLPLPFFPLGTIFLGISLIYKLSPSTQKNQRLFLIFLAISAIIQYIGFVFVMEAAPSEWVNSGNATGFWLTLRNFRSNLNPELSMMTFSISFPLLMIISTIMLFKGIKK